MTENSDQVPVLRCVLSAFVFLRNNFTWFYWVGSLYVLINLANTWLVLFFPTSPGLSGMGALLGIILIPLMVMSFAAYLRRGLGMPSSGLLGLQLGADELRLFVTIFAVGAVAAFIVFIGALAGVFVLSAVIASVVDQAIVEAEPASVFTHAGITGQIAVALVGLAVAALGLYTLARFSPAYPAAIAERRVVVFEAAVWSKGQGWRMALAIILTSLPFYVLLAPGMVQYAQLALASIPAGEGAQVISSIEIDMRPLLWFFILSALLWPASNGAISGLYTTFYRGLRANKEDAS